MWKCTCSRAQYRSTGPRVNQALLGLAIGVSIHAGCRDPSETGSATQGGNPASTRASPTQEARMITARKELKTDRWVVELAGHGAGVPKAFKVVALCKYDPKKRRWDRLDIALKRIPDGSNGKIDLSPALQPDVIGLFYARVIVDMHETGTLIYAGPIRPNDMKIAPAPEGMVIAPVPSGDHAAVMYVPDPKLHCAAPAGSF